MPIPASASMASPAITLPGVVGRSRTILGRRPAVTLSVVILVGLAAVILLLPWIAPLDQASVALDRINWAPSWHHLFGTDELGRDVLLRSLYGLRVSMLVGLVAAAATGLGGVVGLVAAARGGWLDRALMRVVDTVSALPHLLLGIFIVAMLRPSLKGVVLSVALTHWISTARIVRSETLSLRERPFIDAAISGGASRRRILVRHYLPHVGPQVLLAATLMVPHAVYHETALSFLGLGLPPHLASIGNMINDGRRSLLGGAWWPSVIPGLLIVVVTLALSCAAGWWRDRLNPRLRAELEL